MKNTTLGSFLTFIKFCIFPEKTTALLGVVLGGISIIALINHTLQVGLSETFLLIINWYDRFLSVALGWMQPYLESVLRWLFSFFVSIDFELNPHWKHIFVVMNLYFMRNVFSYVRENGAVRDWTSTITVLVISIVVSLVVSGVTGTFSATGFQDNLIIAWTPLIGFYLYDVIERVCTVLLIAPKDAYHRFDLSRTEAFIKYFGWSTERMMGTLAISFALVFFLDRASYGNLTNFGVAVFLISTLLIAFYWVSGRASLGFRFNQNDLELPFLLRAIKHSGTIYLGGAMLGTAFWFFIFMISNAGLSLVGL